MTKKKQVGVRFDSNRTRLKTGETQRPNGTYAYRWSTPDGKRHSIYAPTLEKLREQEDVRGIITIAVNVTSDDIRQAVSGAQGGGIQLKKTLITYPARRVAVTKRVTVVDDAELGLSHPPLKTVIRADACITSFDKKVLSGKLLTKGEAEVSLLYVPYVAEGSGEDATPQNIKFSVPFSQISDVEGLDVFVKLP